MTCKMESLLFASTIHKMPIIMVWFHDNTTCCGNLCIVYTKIWLASVLLVTWLITNKWSNTDSAHWTYCWTKKYNIVISVMVHLYNQKVFISKRHLRSGLTYDSVLQWIHSWCCRPNLDESSINLYHYEARILPLLMNDTSIMMDLLSQESLILPHIMNHLNKYAAISYFVKYPICFYAREGRHWKRIGVCLN